MNSDCIDPDHCLSFYFASWTWHNRANDFGESTDLCRQRQH